MRRGAASPVDPATRHEQEGALMMAKLHASAVAIALPLVLASAASALAQKAGGILQMLDFASPASMSIHEESTIATLGPMMG
jgi:hypothetical protein